MSDKLFQFLNEPRQPPRTVPVAIRVLGYGEIGGDFNTASVGTQAERCIDCGNSRSRTSTLVTLTPQALVCVSMTC